jgi:hypothetical protein
LDITQQLLSAAGLLAPGFIAMKLFYVFGAQRQRSQWEWTTWSVLISLPIDWVTAIAAPSVEANTKIPSLAADLATRYGFAIGAAAVACYVWRKLKQSDKDRVVWLRRALTDSAWDEVTDDAVLHKRYLEVVTRGDNDREVTFKGWLSTAGREDSRAEPWLYLRQVEERTEPDGRWRETAGLHGLLLHRDHIERIRVLDETKDTETDAGSGSGLKT